MVARRMKKIRNHMRELKLVIVEGRYINISRGPARRALSRAQRRAASWHIADGWE